MDQTLYRNVSQTNRFLAFIGNAVFNQLIPTDFSGTEGLSQLFELTVSGYCKNSQLILDTLLHQPVGIQISDQQQTRVFHGYVAQVINLGITGHNLRRFTLSLRPQLWFLNFSQHCQIFSQQTIPDLVRSILQQQQIPSINCQNLTNHYPIINYCVQYNETDLQFVLRLSEEAGIYFYFTYSLSAHTLHLIDNLQELPYLSPVFAFSNALQDGAYIHDWQSTWQLTADLISLNDYNYETPTADLIHQSQAVNSTAITGLLSTPEKYLYPGEYQNNAAAVKKVNLMLMRETGQKILTTGASNVLAFSNGLKFQFNNLNTEEQKETYILLEIKHQAHDTSHINLLLSENNMASQSYQNAFIAHNSILPYAPPCQYKKPLINGYHNAIVAGAADKAITTDKLGRIQVIFPWDEKQQSCWIRVAQQQVGLGWGTHFLPGIGQEVIIQYLDGDIDKPICVGALYNAIQKTPYALPDMQHLSGIKTQNDDPAKSHEVQFNDLPDQEMLTLRVQNQFVETIQHDAEHIIGNVESTVITDSQQSMIQGIVSYQSPKQILLKAEGGYIEINPQTIKIKGVYINAG